MENFDNYEELCVSLFIKQQTDVKRTIAVTWVKLYNTNAFLMA